MTTREQAQWVIALMGAKIAPDALGVQECLPDEEHGGVVHRVASDALLRSGYYHHLKSLQNAVDRAIELIDEARP